MINSYLLFGGIIHIMIKTVLSKAFKISQKNFFRILLMVLPLMVVAGLSNSASYNPNNFNGLLALVSFIFSIVYLFLGLATDIGLLISKRNNAFKFKNLFEMFQRKGFTVKVIGIFLILFFMIVAVLIIGLIASIFIGIGSISIVIGSSMKFFPFVGLLISSLIVLGIIVFGIVLSYGLAFLFIKFYDDFLQGQDNIIYVFKSTWNLMRGYKFKLFLVNLISGLIALVLVGIFGLLIYLSSLLMSTISWLAIALMVIFAGILFISVVFWFIWNKMIMITFYDELSSK